MQYYELNEEEQQELEAIENAIENGTLDSALDFDERKKELQQVAKATLNKTRNINIRLSERDVYKLKARAAKEGLPYQTLVASILHQTASK